MFEKEYAELIDNARQSVRNKGEGNFETHHIKPRSLGGSDNNDNLVLLTPEEHYLAHYYLWKITNTKQMAAAFWFISNFQGKYISEEEYAVLRKQAAEAAAERQRKPVYCLELDTVFPSSKDACLAIGERADHSSYIGEVCNGKHKACFEWKDGLRYHWCWEKDAAALKEHREELLFEERMRKKLTGRSISLAKKGMDATNRIGILCIETNEHFASLKDAAASCGGSTQYLRKNALKGTPYHGYHWRLDNQALVPLKSRSSHMKGKRTPEETRDKISNAMKKHVPGVICVETGEKFDCAKDAAKSLGKKSGSYLLECARSGKQCYGYHWKAN